MSTKKITLTVGGSRFDIELESRFAEYLEKRMYEDLNMESNNNFKVLLQAYVRANYELFEQEKQMKQLLETLDRSLSSQP